MGNYKSSKYSQVKSRDKKPFLNGLIFILGEKYLRLSGVSEWSLLAILLFLCDSSEHCSLSETLQ